MNIDDAIKVASRNLKTEAIETAQRAITRAENDLAWIEDRGIDYFFPFRKRTTFQNDNIWDCGAGATIWKCKDTAQIIADLTGQPFKFRHNDSIYELTPQKG